MINNLSAATIWVKDQNEALRFYTEKLGFVIRNDVTVGGYRWLSVGLKNQPELEINLAALKPGGHLTEDDVIALTKLVETGKMGGGVWKTDNCRTAYEEMSAKGVEFIQPPTDRPYGTVDAVFKDTSGNVFVLSEDKPKR